MIIMLLARLLGPAIKSILGRNRPTNQQGPYQPGPYQPGPYQPGPYPDQTSLTGRPRRARRSRRARDNRR